MKRLILIVAIALGLTGLSAAVSLADKEEKEEKIELKDCPKAVQETIKKEAGSGKIVEIEKETEKGKVVYEAEVIIDGKEYEITVGEDGKLISKEAEDEEDDDDDE